MLLRAAGEAGIVLVDIDDAVIETHGQPTHCGLACGFSGCGGESGGLHGQTRLATISSVSDYLLAWEV